MFQFFVAYLLGVVGFVLPVIFSNPKDYDNIYIVYIAILFWPFTIILFLTHMLYETAIWTHKLLVTKESNKRHKSSHR